MVSRSIMPLEGLKLMPAADPIFFLHHAQLDHLWWLWQQQDLQRLKEYAGKHMYNSTDDNASGLDMLQFGGFVEDIPVVRVMNTKNGFLCYQY